MKRIGLVLLAALIAGCAGMTVQGRLSQLDDLARAYGRALRWSDFQTAYALTRTSAEAPLDAARLKDIQVTSYELLNTAPTADGKTAQQIAEIKYVNTRRMAERTLLDQQDWAYSEPDSRWYLRSAFPDFK